MMDKHEENSLPNGYASDSIELFFRGLKEMETEDVALLILTNSDSTRYLPVFIDKWSEAQILLRQDKESHCELRLPEVLCAVFPELNADKYLLEIDDVVQNGIYVVHLVSRETHRRFRLCVSDAVLLAQVAHIPLLIPRTLFDKQSVPFAPEVLTKPFLEPLTRIPLASCDLGSLCEMLNKAVAEEDYEEAQRIKLELERRAEKPV